MIAARGEDVVVCRGWATATTSGIDADCDTVYDIMPNDQGGECHYMHVGYSVLPAIVEERRVSLQPRVRTATGVRLETYAPATKTNLETVVRGGVRP
jgi:hypothetical protein